MSFLMIFLPFLTHNQYLCHTREQATREIPHWPKCYGKSHFAYLWCVPAGALNDLLNN